MRYRSEDEIIAKDGRSELQRHEGRLEEDQMPRDLAYGDAS